MLGAVATTALSSDSPLSFGARASVGLNWLMIGYLPSLTDKTRWCVILKLVEALTGGKGDSRQCLVLQGSTNSGPSYTKSSRHRCNGGLDVTVTLSLQVHPMNSRGSIQSIHFE